MSTQSEPEIAMKAETEGSGDPLVLVPGGLTGWLSWKPHVEQLSTARRVTRVQLVAVDLGLSNAPLPQNYSVDYEIQALKNTLDAQRIQQADFAAWSYGAEITLSFAIGNPERVRSLTLIEPPAIWVLRSRGPLTGNLMEEQKAIQKLGPDDITEDQLVWFAHFAGFVPSHLDPRAFPQWPVWMQHRRSLRTQDVVFQHEDSIEKVASFPKPVLLFKGEGSSSFLHDIIDILGEDFPNAEAQTLPGGHAPHVVSMEQFMGMFVRFLEQTE